MANYYSERMKRTTDHDLKRMVEEEYKYVPEAIEAAIEELDSRKNGISEYIDIAKKENKKVKNLVAEMPRSKPGFRYIRSFFNLIRHPNAHRIRTSIGKRFALTFRFYFLTQLFLIVSMIPLMILEGFELITIPEQFDYIPSFFNNKIDRLLSTLLIPIFAGLIEETEYRLVLSPFNKKYFDIFLSLVISHLIARWFGQYFITYTEFYSNFLMQSTLIYGVFALPIYFTLSRTHSHSSWFEKNWKLTYKYLFYVLALVFATAHLPTMDLTSFHLAFWPLIILPFFVYAMVFSYVRIRIGFWYAVLLHFGIDLVIMVAKY